MLIMLFMPIMQIFEGEKWVHALAFHAYYVFNDNPQETNL